MVNLSLKSGMIRNTVKNFLNNNFFINKIIKDYGNNTRCIVSTKIN